MPIFIVSYDIPEENRDEYKELWDELKRLKSQKVQKSVYLVPVKDEMSQDELYNAIWEKLGIGDSLLVAKITTRPRIKRGISGTKDWLDRHFAQKTKR